MNDKYIPELNFEEMGGRIKLLRDKMKQVDFAELFGLEQQDISKIENANIRPSLDLIRKLSVRYNKPIEWILTGEDTRIASDIDAFSFIPKYKLRLSGGHGAYILSQDTESALAFRKSWINSRCFKEKCGLFEVSGDSMSPLICHLDIVLVDMSHNDPEEVIEGKVYAFSEGDRVRIKRLSWRSNVLWAMSENKTESPDGPIDKDGFRIIGKVIWVGHEIR